MFYMLHRLHLLRPETTAQALSSRSGTAYRSIEQGI